MFVSAVRIDAIRNFTPTGVVVGGRHRNAGSTFNGIAVAVVAGSFDDHEDFAKIRTGKSDWRALIAMSWNRGETVDLGEGGGWEEEGDEAKEC